MAQIKLNAQTNSATDLGLSGLFKSSVTCIYIVLFLSQTVTCSLWGYIELVSFSHCTSTTIVLHLNSLISFWYHDVISTEMYCDCLENLVIMPRQSQAALPKLASWLDTLLCCMVSSTSISEPSLVLWTDNAMYFYIFRTRFTLLLAESRKHMCVGNKVSGKPNSFGHMQVSSSWERTQAGLVLLCQCFSMAVPSREFAMKSSDD